jgi:hypothetical protein
MIYVVEMGSGVMIYISVLLKTGLAIQKLMVGIHRHTDKKETA